MLKGMESVNTINKRPPPTLPSPNKTKTKKPVVMYMENCAQQIFL